MTEAKVWRYSAFGLTIDADRPLPELYARRSLAERGSKLSIRVDIGDSYDDAPGEDGDYVRELTRDRVVVHDPRYGWLIMTPGRIQVRLNSDDCWESMRTYVLGTALGVALYQFGHVPFHISAVCWDGAAVAFTGASGAGKSTIAAACVLGAGAELLCDDTAVLEARTDGKLSLWPGAALNKLCDDVMGPLGLDARPHSGSDRKHGVASARLAVEACQLRALLAISADGSKPAGTVERLRGLQAVKVWLDAVYRPEYGSGILGGTALHERVLQYCALVPVYRLYRTPFLTQLNHSVEAVQKLWPEILALP